MWSASGMNPLSTKRSNRRDTLQTGGKMIGQSVGSFMRWRTLPPCGQNTYIHQGHRLAPQLSVNTEWRIRSASPHITLHGAGHQDYAQPVMHDHNLSPEVGACPLDQVRAGRQVESEVLERAVEVVSRGLLRSRVLPMDEFTSAIFLPSAPQVRLLVNLHASQDV
jgi:hypothetical protein